LSSVIWFKTEWIVNKTCKRSFAYYQCDSFTRIVKSWKGKTLSKVKHKAHSGSFTHETSIF
ncbi:hypothetical protein KQJ29_37830, partial [Enterococcus sp. S181_ASV_20]|nr:hypothetical protein [Enterococcus sp. S181_ASV_20]